MTEIDRRKVITGAGGLALGVFLGGRAIRVSAREMEPFEKSTSIESVLRSVRPRPDHSPNALYKIPESLLPRKDRGAQIMPLHMEDLMKLFRNGEKITANSKGREALYFPYLIGLFDAIRRGEEVTLVLEMPVDPNNDYNDWENYLKWLIPQIPEGANIIVGNEMLGMNLVGGDNRIGGDSKNAGNWEEFTRMFATAHDAIRNQSVRRLEENSKISSEQMIPTKILLSAPLYLGHHAEIQKILEAITAYNSQNPVTKITLDGSALHFYDTPEKLIPYITGHKQILAQIGFYVPLFLTEYGKGESNDIPPTQVERNSQARDIFLMTGLVSLLIDAKVLQSGNAYTAFSEGQPRLSMFDRSGYNLSPTIVWEAYQIARKIFKNTILKDDGSIVSRPNQEISFRTIVAQSAGTVQKGEAFLHLGKVGINFTNNAKVEIGDIIVEQIYPQKRKIQYD